MTSLQMIRAIIGLCIGAVRDVRLLYNGGYSRVLVELPLTVLPEGDFVVDILIHSPDANHAVVWELKSGGRIRPQQATKFSRLRANQFRDQAFLHVPDFATFRWDVVYLSPAENAPQIARGLGQLGLGHCVAAASSDRIQLHTGQLSTADLNAAFHGGLQFDVLGVDESLFPFDANSGPDEIVRFLVPALASLASDRVEEFSIEEITALAFGSGWSFLIRAEGAKRQIFGAVRDILDASIRQELAGVLARGPRSQSLGRHRYNWVGETVFREDGDTRVGLFHALRNLHDRYFPNLAAEFEMAIDDEMLEVDADLSDE